MGILSGTTSGILRDRADRLGVNLAKTMGSGSTKSSGSGSSKKKKEEAPSAPAQPKYGNDALLSGYHNLFYGAYQPEQLTYTERTADEISAEIAAWLRPAYDAAIGAREKQTDTYRAELDADAIARGMGTSSYVTDVKNRQMQKEAEDVAALETNYAAQLAKEMSAALAIERERSFETDMFNAEAEQNAYDKAYSMALSMLQAYHAGDKGAVSLANSILGGGTSTSSAASSSAGSKKSGSSGKTSGAEGTDASTAVQAVGATSPENCERFLSGLSASERNSIYYGGSSEDVAYRKELLQSVGISGYQQLVKKYPGSA